MTEHFDRCLKIALTVIALVALLVFNLPATYNSALIELGRWVSGPGNRLFLIASNSIFIFWALYKRDSSLIKMCLILNLAMVCVVQGLKLIHIPLVDDRPNGLIGGFPSGHAAHAFSMAFLLAFFLPRYSWCWYSFATLIACARIVTYWHTALQVSAGVLIAAAITFFLIRCWLHLDATALSWAHKPISPVSFRSAD